MPIEVAGLPVFVPAPLPVVEAGLTTVVVLFFLSKAGSRGPPLVDLWLCRRLAGGGIAGRDACLSGRLIAPEACGGGGLRRSQLTLRLFQRGVKQSLTPGRDDHLQPGAFRAW